MAEIDSVFSGEKSFAILEGHFLEALKQIPDGSVHCIVTSPPYWGLRKYSGLPSMVFGGEKGCEHDFSIQHGEFHPGQVHQTIAGKSTGVAEGGQTKTTSCIKCGAWLGDFGLEPTLELYIEHSMLALDECWRVLRKDGTCWWNLGDSYANTGGHTKQGENSQRKGRSNVEAQHAVKGSIPEGLKPKDLCLVPFRFALAAQARGWWVRSAIVWAKPNPMPESCTDRPTDAYEFIFLLTKAKNYWYDAEAVREEPSGVSLARVNQPNFDNQTGGPKDYSLGINPNRSMRKALENFAKNPGRNLRNVWTFPTQPFSGAHFATFPEKLPELCIKAGCPERTCEKCGAGWVRILDKRPAGQNGISPADIGKDIGQAMNFKDITLGWKPACKCGAEGTGRGVVLDPFCGSGTTGLVANRLGRRFIGIELSQTYAAMSKQRIIADAPLFNQ